VRRALRLIAEEGLGDDGVDSLAERLGIGARHLRRLFAEQVGAPPSAIAHTRRLHFARKLIDETELPVSDVAFASGFASVRRFNDAMHKTFRRSPTELRRARRRGATAEGPGVLTLRVPYTTPYDHPQVLAFLRVRATPGVELVGLSSYARTLTTAAGPAILEVSPSTEGAWLDLRLHGPVSRELFSITERVRALFDVAVDPRAVGEHLARDPVLADLLRSRPGLRVPGAWDGFELAVRAVLGQQVSVAGATTLAGRLARAFGEPLAEGALAAAYAGALTHLFPTAPALVDAPVESIGLPRARALAIRALAAAVVSGEISFGGHAGLDAAVDALTRLPGIGPWTAHYIAMRALREPDALPASDLVLRASIVPGRALSTREVEARAEAWRPWRAYAVLHLWTRAALERKTSTGPSPERELGESCSPR
jgi:AraC family transcriptional regulator of adaptative response / DNA-3-methyladenine glycosylase II